MSYPPVTSSVRRNLRGGGIRKPSPLIAHKKKVMQHSVKKNDEKSAAEAGHHPHHLDGQSDAKKTHNKGWRKPGPRSHHEA